MPVPFKIFPKFGYINGHFQVLCFHDEVRIVIERDGKCIMTLLVSNGKLHTIVGLNIPGLYTAKCEIDNRVFTQEFEVRNAIRLGTSELKACYVFDDMPYSFFLMKDRMHIYDESRQTLFFENNISPTEIYKLSNQLLLFVTRIGNGQQRISNYGLYSIAEFTLTWEIKNSFQEVYFSEKDKLLWVYNSYINQLVCFSFMDLNTGYPQRLYVLDDVISYHVINEEGGLLAETETTLTLVSIDTKTIEILKKTDSIAVAQDGMIYRLIGDSITYNSFKEKFANSLNMKSLPLVDFAVEDFIFLGDKFIFREPLKFDDEIRELIFDQSPKADSGFVHFFRPANLITSKITTVSHLVPQQFGTFVISRNITKSLEKITYTRDGEIWQGKPSVREKVTYDLSFVSDNTNNLIKSDIVKYSVIFSSKGLMVVTIDDCTLFLRGDVTIKKMPKIVGVDPMLNINGNSFLLIKTSILTNTFDLFSIVDNAVLLENVRVLNHKFLRFHQAVWYAGEIKDPIWRGRYTRVFDLRTLSDLNVVDSALRQSKFDDAAQLTFYEKYCVGSKGVLIDVKNIHAIDAVVGSVVCVSQTLFKVVSRRGDVIYFGKYNKVDSKYELRELPIKQEKYTNAQLSPDGNFLMLQKQPNAYVYYDVYINEEIKMFSEKFIGFSKDGNLIFERDRTRSAKIVDPLTWEDVTPLNYHYYKFLSPDGNLFGTIAVKTKYFDKIKNEYISHAEYLKIKGNIDTPTEPINDEALDKVRVNRASIFKSNEGYFQKIGICDSAGVRSYHFVSNNRYGEIGVVGTGVMTEFKYPSDMHYVNYGAFSYDSKYYGFVGKPTTRGLIQILRIDFNPKKNTLDIKDVYVSRLPNRACWVCGFSRLGYFAAYDSVPNTYIIKIDDIDFSEKWNIEDIYRNIRRGDGSVYNTSFNWNVIYGKNFICFSPTGVLLALSEQGYEPLTLGGYGHQDSPALHLASTLSGKIIHSFTDHGDIIKEDVKSNISFVAFSADETKMMSMSRDGVVIVRDIKFIRGNTIMKTEAQVED